MLNNASNNNTAVAALALVFRFTLSYYCLYYSSYTLSLVS
jgi:hypothetical protein